MSDRSRIYLSSIEQTAREALYLVSGAIDGDLPYEKAWDIAHMRLNLHKSRGEFRRILNMARDGLKCLAEECQPTEPQS